MMPASLRVRFGLALAAAALAGVVVHAGLTAWPLPQALAWLRTALWLGRAWRAPAPGGAAAPEALRTALEAGEDALFGVPIDGVDETFHVSQRGFRLQGRPHRLYLLRRMTRELSRQEVASWKRLIRVVSHELNNSLAPI